MHTREKYSLIAAAAVALGSIAMSAFIVTFIASEAPGAAARQALHGNNSASVSPVVRTQDDGRIGNVQPPQGADVADSAPKSMDTDYAWLGALVGIAILFGVIAWWDRCEELRARSNNAYFPIASNVPQHSGDVRLSDAEDVGLAREPVQDAGPAVAILALTFGLLRRHAETATPQVDARPVTVTPPLDGSATTIVVIRRDVSALATLDDNRRHVARRAPCQTSIDSPERRSRARRKEDSVDSGEALRLSSNRLDTTEAA